MLIPIFVVATSFVAGCVTTLLLQDRLAIRVQRDTGGNLIVVARIDL